MRTELTEDLHTWMASGRTASVDGTHVWYRVEGRGPWLKLIWGRLDPIAVYAIAKQLQARNPLIALNTLDDVGHYPQLEAADQVAACMLESVAHK